jgi:hypothetical protein
MTLTSGWISCTRRIETTLLCRNGNSATLMITVRMMIDQP